MNICEELEKLNNKLLFKEYQFTKNNNKLKEAISDNSKVFMNNYDNFNIKANRCINIIKNYSREVKDLVNRFINSCNMLEDIGMIRSNENSEATNIADMAFIKVEKNFLLTAKSIITLNKSYNDFKDFCKSNNLLDIVLKGSTLNERIEEFKKESINPLIEIFNNNMNSFKEAYLENVINKQGLEDTIVPFDKKFNSTPLSKRADEYFTLEYFLKNCNKVA